MIAAANAEIKDLPIKALPFAHQSDAYNAALGEIVGEPRRIFDADGKLVREKGRGYSLLMDMGTGKTITSIAIAGRLYLDGHIKRVLIVAPKSIVGVWQGEFAKFADFDYNLAILDGSRAKRADTLRHMTGSALQVSVINYEGARLLKDEILTWIKAAKGASLAICDESHKIKSAEAAVSKALWKIGDATGFRMILTGTLITNKPLDVFSQFRFASPKVFGLGHVSWRNEYFYACGYQNHDRKLKKSKEREFTDKIHSIAFRATKSECLDLPATTDIVHYVDLEDNAAKIYRNLVNDSYTELAKGGEVTATNVLTRLLRLCQVTGGFLTGDDDPKPQPVSTAKLDALTDIIETAQGSGQKLVIIARFIGEIAAVKRLLEKRGIGYAVISGETKNRAEEVRKFQEDPDITVFIGQISTAGLGITLTAASTLVFYSLNYSMSDFEQAKARIHRVGQTAPCSYIYLVARKTVDEKVLKALNEKADLARILIDDYRRGANPFA